MSSVQLRRFTRGDRDQVTALVNAHIGAVVPNLSVSVQGLMSQLEREPGEIRWLVCWPDSGEAGAALARACVDQLERWGVSRCYADGALPAPSVYGIPEQWPHVRGIYQRAGFRHDGHTELVFLARVADLPRPHRPPSPGLTSQRTVGINGTRISAVLDTDVIGYIEIDTMLAPGYPASTAGPTSATSTSTKPTGAPVSGPGSSVRWPAGSS
ncbi:MAG: hypothetical protein ACRDRA_10945 [Pseudonocardiaceae bacterium]